MLLVDAGTYLIRQQYLSSRKPKGERDAEFEVHPADIPAG